MKKRRVALILIFVGLCTMLYPFVRIVFSEYRVEKAASTFMEKEAKRPAAEKDALAAAIHNYNARLSQGAESFSDPFASSAPIPESAFNDFSPDALLGYIRIPALSEVQPIYFGASDKNMSRGVALIEGTSFPTGTDGTRPVLAGHRGYYTFNGFLYINNLEEGDDVFLDIFDKTLHYKVTDQESIPPWAGEKLKSVEGKNMLTLLTCHPYPTARERLLVNCRYVPQDPDVSETPSDEKSVTMFRKSGTVQAFRILFRVVTVILSAAILFVLYKFIRPFREKEE
ncbi:MAG: class C sortase [Eubacteriales bacterium]|nr:class C sortase [Eubacteriales bacterium]